MQKAGIETSQVQCSIIISSSGRKGEEWKVFALSPGIAFLENGRRPPLPLFPL